MPHRNTTSCPGAADSPARGMQAAALPPSTHPCSLRTHPRFCKGAFSCQDSSQHPRSLQKDPRSPCSLLTQLRTVGRPHLQTEQIWGWEAEHGLYPSTAPPMLPTPPPAGAARGGALRLPDRSQLQLPALPQNTSQEQR